MPRTHFAVWCGVTRSRRGALRAEPMKPIRWLWEALAAETASTPWRARVGSKEYGATGWVGRRPECDAKSNALRTGSPRHAEQTPPLRSKYSVHPIVLT